ncbi:hypothetical protein ABTH20_20740, partial [Acinetobacter baumannii]
LVRHGCLVRTLIAASVGSQDRKDRNTLKTTHVERHAPFFIARLAGFPDMPRSSIPGIRTGLAGSF